MKIISLTFILLFLTSFAKSSDINITYAYYIMGILEHKENNQDPSSYSCYVGDWDHFDSSYLFGDYFEHNQGIMTTSSLFSKISGHGFLWSLGFTFYDGRYVDQNLANIRMPYLNFPYSFDVIDEANGTLFISNATLVTRFEDSSGQKISTLNGSLSIYVVERSTMKPPVSIDQDHLSKYTLQFMWTENNSTFSFITPFFNKTYPISTLDKIIVVIGSIAYAILSFISRKKHDKRTEVSFGALACLYLYPFYVLSYIVVWFNQQNFLWEVLTWFIPFFLAILADIVRNSILLINHQKCSPNYSFGIIFAFILSFAFVYIPCLGVLAPSFFLLPQILYKFREKKTNVWYRSITIFEVGNWTCMSMWIVKEISGVYVKLYPNNILLLSPVPSIVASFFGVIFLQLLIIAYIKFFVPGKEIFKYTFIEEDPNRISQLLLDQCAICLNNLKSEENGDDDKLYKTPCGHVFHSECLLEWSEKKLLCPCCRKKLPELIHPIN